MAAQAHGVLASGVRRHGKADGRGTDLVLVEGHRHAPGARGHAIGRDERERRSGGAEPDEQPHRAVRDLVHEQVLDGGDQASVAVGERGADERGDQTRGIHASAAVFRRARPGPFRLA